MKVTIAYKNMLFKKLIKWAAKHVIRERGSDLQFLEIVLETPRSFLRINPAFRYYLQKLV
jgi:hypothetical protein